MLGEKIRNVRKNKGIKLKELAKRTDLSSSYISQVERCLIDPSIASLKKIAIALEVPIHEFLRDDENKGILIKKEDRIKLELPRSNVSYEFLTPTKIKNTIPKLQIVYMKMEPLNWGYEGFASHLADELIYVEKGEIDVYLGDEKYHLTKGDSLYIQENTPHKIYNCSEKISEIVFSMSPPIY